MTATIATAHRIALIGLGYVGLPLAVEFGKHFPVIGFDTHAQRIDELNAGYDRTLETTPIQRQEATHLRYSADVADLLGCDVFIITVPTPVDSSHRPDLTHLVKASETVGGAMSAGALVI